VEINIRLRISFFSFRLLGDYLLVLLSQLPHTQNLDHVISSKISFEGLVSMP
jgi:hypothetical protein